jgi:hypothetical protein
MIETKNTIPIPVFDYRIYVIFTDDLIGSADKLVKDGKLRGNHGVDDSTDGFHVIMSNQNYGFIVLKYKATINHIVHETYHAVSTMFNWISARHEEEIFAYFMGYVVELISVDQEKANKKLTKALDKLQEL